MVPAAFVLLDRLPLTPNGKVDRKALPAPAAAGDGAREREPPLGATETVLARIWCEVLGLERVGRRDNFFELGGHSLLAMQVASRVRDDCHVELSVRDLFTDPTVWRLAARIDAQRAQPGAAADARSRVAGSARSARAALDREQFEL
jgi:hypothetical protein